MNPPTRDADGQDGRLPLCVPSTWPGRPAPVVLVVSDSLHAVAAARWAARAARHRVTDLALVVLVPCPFATVPIELADDARAVAARVLPTVGAYAVTAHAVAVTVSCRAAGRAAARAEARAVAGAAAALGAPLVVVVGHITGSRGRTLLAELPADVLFVPAVAAARTAVSAR